VAAPAIWSFSALFLIRVPPLLAPQNEDGEVHKHDRHHHEDAVHGGGNKQKEARGP
jgi:hypothetical protein